MEDGAQNKNYTASALVHTGVGRIYGIVVNSHTSGTIRVLDSLVNGSGRVIFNTTTLATGPQILRYPKGANFYTGLYVDIANTTVDYTPLWN